MARPLRIEYPGALYHVTSRGNAREDIFFDDGDRQRFLTTCADVVRDYHWISYAYCLMTNHYHLLIETPKGKSFSGHATAERASTREAVDRRHGRVGHIFGGTVQGISRGEGQVSP